MTTKYSICTFDNQNYWKSIALVADTADFNAMVNFCVMQFANGNSLSTPAQNICILDRETGEILWDYCNNFAPDDCESSDFNEDCGFDPYMGCYTEDC